MHRSNDSSGSRLVIILCVEDGKLRITAPIATVASLTYCGVTVALRCV